MNEKTAKNIFERGKMELKKKWDNGEFDGDYRLKANCKRPPFEKAVDPYIRIELDDNGEFIAIGEIPSGCGCCLGDKITANFNYE